MTLLLIRHGETALNASRTLQPADTPLSERGLAQGRALALRVSGVGSVGDSGGQRIAGIVSSDLPRALQTAQAIAAATGLPVATSALLEERNFGDWRGLPHASFGFDPLAHAGAPPGGESHAAFAQRVARAFAHILAVQATLGGPLVVVTHGLVLREWLTAHVTRPAGVPLPTHLGNTGVTVIEAEAPHRARLIDCTLHLDALAADDAQALSGG
jgi:broad specificity phosphatase PhoE